MHPRPSQPGSIVNRPFPPPPARRPLPAPFRLAGAAVFGLLAASLSAATGDLDTSFGSGGKVVTPVGANFDWAYALVVQPDGKIIAGGFASDSASDFVLIRHTASGALDPDFGGTGIVTTSLQTTGGEAVRALALQPDGRIIAAGYTLVAGTLDFAVARYHRNGVLDTSFNGAGFATTPVGGGHDRCTAVALQPDGRIVLAGYASDGANNDFALVRFRGDGTLDGGFGVGGKVVTPVSAGLDEINAVALQDDGKIVVAGRARLGTYAEFALARYLTNGVLDASFNGTGILTTSITSGDDVASGVAVDGEGRIVAVGEGKNQGTPEIVLVRCQGNGALDTGFDSDGMVTTRIGEVSGSARAVVLQPGGRILVAGGAFEDRAGIGFARYLDNGALDTGFSGDGLQRLEYVDGIATAWALGVQPDGGIVAAGYTNTGDTDDFILVRLLGDPGADADGDGLRDSWEHFHWGGLTGNSAWDDADHDGYVDLMELALGLNPAHPDPAGLPPMTLDGGYLRLSLVKRAGAAYEAQSADTLLPGQPGSFSPGGVTVLEDSAAAYEARDTIGVADADRRYLRLKVTAAP